MASISWCKSVGSANPDIAGIGILVAFITQALISLVLSFWSYFLSTKRLQVLRPDLPMFQENTLPAQFGLFPVLSVLLRSPVWWRSRDRRHAAERLQELRGRHEHTGKKLEIVNGILLYTSDAQTLNGIALLASGLIASKSLDLYHLHIIYDTVNFTGVSNCAGIFCSISASADARSKRVSRYMSIALFAIIYLAFAIVFGVRLNQWDPEVPGSCYNTAATATANYPHPHGDIIYLGITCAFFYSVLFAAIHDPNLTKRFKDEMAKLTPKTYMDYIMLALTAAGLDTQEARVNDRNISILTLAMMQFPLHLYFVIALRATNQHLVEGGSEENSWGFGQVVAIAMLGGTIMECCKGVKEYWQWKRSSQPNIARASIDGPVNLLEMR